jgi:hypothetical protein
MVHPERVHFPRGERTTYTAAAIVLATDAFAGRGPAAGLFLGQGLPPLVPCDVARSGTPRARERTTFLTQSAEGRAR